MGSIGLTVARVTTQGYQWQLSVVRVSLLLVALQSGSSFDILPGWFPFPIFVFPLSCAGTVILSATQRNVWTGIYRVIIQWKKLIWHLPKALIGWRNLKWKSRIMVLKLERRNCWRPIL